MSPQYLVTTILVCCLALTVISAKSSAYRPKKLACCVKYTQRPISMNAINGVTIQDSRGPCRLSAIIFHTTTMDVCATVKDKWVKRILQQLSVQFTALAKALDKHKLLDKEHSTHTPVMHADSTNTTLMDEEGS